ncbi:MAG: MBL fold metallo-hydrolase [Lachnospiraceae bacterium]|nr:MBL fold metallo-hydrolase [Lachnospiraceae bacterium]
MKADNLKVLGHFAVRLDGEHVVYFDPFHLKNAPQDGEIILITHEHYDHLSPEDIRKAARADAWIVLPKSCRPAAVKAGLDDRRLLYLSAGEEADVLGVKIEAVPAYNVGKRFHTRDKGWLGYVVTMNGLRYYLAGDTDDNEDVRKVRCDVAVVPVGGTYTMTAEEAAVLVNAIRPKVAVPAHYGDIVGTVEDAERFAKRLDPAIACDFAR